MPAEIYRDILAEEEQKEKEKKYIIRDCSKVLDYLHEAKRMCDDHYFSHNHSCEDCPFDEPTKGCGIELFIDRFSDHYNEHKIMLVQEWADEHLEERKEEDD